MRARALRRGRHYRPGTPEPRQAARQLRTASLATAAAFRANSAAGDHHHGHDEQTKDRLGPAASCCSRCRSRPSASARSISPRLNVLTWQRMSRLGCRAGRNRRRRRARRARQRRRARRTRRRPRIATYGGRDYTSDRAAIIDSAPTTSATSSNDLYCAAARRAASGRTGHRLRRSRESGRRHAEPRAALAAARNGRSCFALVFGGVGFGLLFGARYAAKKVGRRTRAAAAVSRRAVALARGMGERTHRGHRVARQRTWRSASPCSGISSRCRPRCSCRARSRDGNTIAPSRCCSRSIGIGLAAWADSRVAAARRFKVATFVLQRVPVALGGRLKGTIRVEAEVPVDDRLPPRARAASSGARAAAARTARRRAPAVAEAMARAAHQLPDQRPRSRRFPSTSPCPRDQPADEHRGRQRQDHLAPRRHRRMPGP